MASRFDSILSRDEQAFCNWFWDGRNGNKLIEALNSNNSNSAGSRIRRRNKWWPHIYCVVLNDKYIPGKGDNRVEWKYCKVGITEVDTTTGTGNRMEMVVKEIKRKTKSKTVVSGNITGQAKKNIEDNKEPNVSILFVLPVEAIDPRPNDEIEKDVREKIGWPVDKELARRIGLPFVTEWVMTTQPHIDKIKSAIVKRKSRRGYVLDTGLVLEFNKQDENIRLRGLEIQEGKVVGEPPVVYGPPT